MLKDIKGLWEREEKGEVDDRFVDKVREVIVQSREFVPGIDMPFKSSSAGSFCSRRFVLASIMNYDLSIKIKPDTGWIFGVGTAYHSHFQEEILQLFGDVFQGWWRCKGCGKLHRGEPLDGALPFKWIPRPKSCECGLKLKYAHETKPSFKFSYVEIEMFDRETNSRGHMDGVLVWKDFTEGLELKTTRSLANVDPAMGGSPYKTHRIQAQDYMRMSGLERVRIVYINKFAESFESAMVEHVLEKKVKVFEQIRDEYLLTREMLKGIRKEIVDSVRALPVAWGKPNLRKLSDDQKVELVRCLPDRNNKCPAKTSKMAKDCPLKTQCFML